MGHAEEAYRELKRQDPGRILIFRGERRTLAALGADAAELRRLAPGHVPFINEPPGASGVEGELIFRAEDLETVLSLILAEGRHAAVLEQVAGDDRPPPVLEVERIVTEGRP